MNSADAFWEIIAASFSPFERSAFRVWANELERLERAKAAAASDLVQRVRRYTGR